MNDAASPRIIKLVCMADIVEEPGGPLCGCLLCDEPHPHPDHQGHRCITPGTRLACSGCENNRCLSHCWAPHACVCWRCR